MLSFKRTLSKVAKDAAAEEWPFRKGDSAHLNRWLEDWRANQIWKKLHPGAFDSPKAYFFIIQVLTFRHLAEQLDQANERVSEAKRARRKAARRRARVTLDSIETPEPFLSVRERSTRSRTLFCRLASLFIHVDTGRWHDAQVAALCETALNSKNITIEMVRHAREAGRRDATRKRGRKA